MTRHFHVRITSLSLADRSKDRAEIMVDGVHSHTLEGVCALTSVWAYLEGYTSECQHTPRCLVTMCTDPARIPFTMSHESNFGG